MTEHKNCHFCGEKISIMAIKCKHCDSKLEQEVFQDARSEEGKVTDPPPPPPPMSSPPPAFNPPESYSRKMPSANTSHASSTPSVEADLPASSSREAKESIRPKSKVVPVIIAALFFVSVAGAAVWFFTSGDGIGELLAKWQNGTSTDSAEEPASQDESVIPDSQDPVVSPVDREAALEESVFKWLASLSGGENFVLMESSTVPDIEEYFNTYLDDQVFVYRVENSTEDSKTLLIGEPFTEAFYRLFMEWENNKWEITGEEDLW